MGPSEKDQLEMLKTIGFESLDELVTSTVPANIRLEEPMELGSHTSAAMSETEALALLRSMADKNQVLKSLIGQGYHETHTPYVILRNMLENPGWYTAYTPYQAEISQGRLEMLLNYQTLVTELTGMEMARTRRLNFRPSRGRRHRRDFVRCGNAASWVKLRHLVKPVGLDDVVNHVGFDETGSNAVGKDVFRRTIARDAAVECQHPGL